MEPVTAIIMAGGESSRMKTDKSNLPINGQPMIAHVLEQLRPHFDQILISAKDVHAYAFPGVEVIADEVQGQGPLMGIVTAIKASAHDLNFVQACDIPNTDMALVKKMLSCVPGYDAVTPRNPDGHCEPLFSVYHKSVLTVMERMLARGQKSVHKVFDLCKAYYVDIQSGAEIPNLNTMPEYERFIGKK
jgi:molybdopterin-guanine dinucleotide biosynthesis protein A